MTRRVLFSILVLGLLVAPVSAILAQDMMTMGPVGASEHPTLGYILTDARGVTVYFWQGDTAGAETSNCYDACAGAWPPFLVDELETMEMEMMGMMPMGFGAIVRNDMTYQLTYNGWPLYYFVRDTAPGDANGEGSMGFGARWSVVTLDPTMMGM